MRLHHLTLASKGRHALFENQTVLRRALHALAAAAGAELVLFHLIGDHLHAVLACELDGDLEHPALIEGSCFQDLVGARYLPGLRLRLRQALPEFRLRDALRVVGLPERPIEAAGSDLVRRLGLGRLRHAAEVSLAVSPGLAGRAQLVVDAKVAIAHVAGEAGYSQAEVGRSLGLSRSAAHHLWKQAPSAAHDAAIRTRLAIEEVASAYPFDFVACAEEVAAKARRAQPASNWRDDDMELHRCR